MHDSGSSHRSSASLQSRDIDPNLGILQELETQDCDELLPIFELLIWANDVTDELSHRNLRISNSYIKEESLLFLGLAINHPSEEIF